MISKKNLKYSHLLVGSAVFMALILGNIVQVQANEGLNSLAQKFLTSIGTKLERLEGNRSLVVRKQKNSLNGILDGEDLVFSLEKGSIILSEAVFTQKRDDRLYVSLQDFLSAVDFPINIDLEEKRAKGWFVREENTFVMDLNAREVIVNGHQIIVQDDEFFVTDDDFAGLYIESNLLERAFGMEFEYQVSNLRMKLSSRLTLPVEEKIYRQQRRDQLIFADNSAKLPEIKQEYKLLTTPFVDVQLRNSIQKNENRSTDTRSSYSIITANDFLYGGLNTFIAGDDNDTIEQFRFIWDKESQTEEDLFLGFNRVQVGDITTPNLNLVRGSGQELGARFSRDISFLDNQNEQTDVTRFEGNIQPDWDIEVYRNNILVATQTADTTGRYIIEDVPLTFGENNFRLIFYGPQGQISERNELIIRQNNRFEVGQVAYDVSLTSQNEVTFVNDDLGFNNLENSGSLNLIGTFDVGISEDYSLSLGTRFFEADNDNIGQFIVGATGYFDRGIYESNLGVDSNGEFGFSLSSLSSFFGQSIRSDFEYRSDDFDVESSNQDNLIMSSVTSVNGKLTPKIGYRALYDIQEFESGNKRTEINVSTSRNVRRGFIGTGYSFITNEINGVKTDVQSANLNGRYVFRGGVVRGNIIYDIEPDPSIRSLLVALNAGVRKNLTGELQIEHTPDDSLTELRARLNYTGDHFTLSPDIRVNSDNELFAFTTLRFGLGADPYSDGFKVHQQGLTSRGGVSARVFLDENGNGIWDLYEEPLEGVRVTGRQSAQREETNAKGVAFIPSFSAGQLTDIQIDERTLGDPYYISLHEGNSIRARAGQVTLLDFPIAVSGEIDGSIFYRDRRGQKRALANMNIFLVDMDGKIVNTTLTAYDGFYVMSDIHPGDYHLILDPIALEQKGLIQIEPKGYRFAATGSVFFDQNFETYLDEVSPETMVELSNNGEVDTRVVLELGRFKSKLMMAVEWLKYKRGYANILGGLSLFEGLIASDKNEADTRYPLHLGPIADIEKAQEICDLLKAQEQECALRVISTKPDARDRKV